MRGWTKSEIPIVYPIHNEKMTTANIPRDPFPKLYNSIYKHENSNCVGNEISKRGVIQLK